MAPFSFRPGLSLACCAALALVAASVRGDAPDYRLNEMPEYRPGKKVYEIIRLSGLNATRKLLDNWEAGFRQYNPEARFEYDYSGKGSETVPARLYTKLADLGLMREMWPSEILSFYRVFSNDPYVVTAATGSYDAIDKTAAFVVVVNKDNPISRLTIGQLDGIFGEARTGGFEGQYWRVDHARGSAENLRTWGQLGLTGEWKDKAIQTYGFDLPNGFAFFFAQKVLMGGDKWNPNLYEFGFSMSNGEMGINGKPHTKGAAPLVDAVGNDRYGIGYCIPRDLRPGVKVLALAPREGGPYVEASKETVANRTYPLTRSIFWVFNRPPGQPVDPKLKEYLRYVFSRQGQQDVVREGDWLPLTPELVREGLARLE